MVKRCIEPEELMDDTYKGAVKPMTGWPRKVFDQWHKNWEDSLTMLSRPDSVRPVNAISRFTELAFRSNDGAMAAIAKRYDSKAVAEIREMFFGRAGGLDKATKQTFEEAVKARTGANMNKLAEALEPLSRNDQAMKELTRKIQNPKEIKMAGGAIDRAAGVIRKMLDDEIKYAREAGLPVGYQEGYFPRQLDHFGIGSEPEKFKAAATKAYQASGVADAGEAADMAEAWARQIQFGDVLKPGYQDFFNFGNGLPTKDFTKGRTLSKEADEILKEFYITDPRDVLGSYFQRVAQRAEFERRFGREPGSAPDSPTKWDKLKEAMVKEGATEAIPQVINHIQSMTGETPSNIPLWGRKATGWAQTWNMVALLPRATLTSLNELAMFGVRGDGMKDVLKGIGLTISDLVRADPTTGLRDVAEFLGIANQAMHDGAMAARLGGGLETRGQRWLTDQYFRRTGLHRYTEATRVAALGIGQSFIRRVAMDVLEGNSRTKSSTMMLNELGIDAAQHKDFGEWIKRADDGKPTLADLKTGGDMAELYGKALARFADQTIMIPKSSEKPFYASHPIGKLSYGLMSYMFSFQKNVLNRAGQMAWTAGTQKGLTMADRWALMGPARNLPVMLAGAMALNEARSNIYGSEESQKRWDDMSGYDKLIAGFSRSGLTGVLDVPLNLATNIKYQRDPATFAVGPALANAFQMLKSSVQLGQSIKGNYSGTQTDGQLNAAKRRWLKDVYSFGIIPMANAALAIQPVPSLGVAGIQAISSDKAKMGFVNAIAPREEDTPAGRRGITRTVSRYGASKRYKASKGRQRY